MIINSDLESLTDIINNQVVTKIDWFQVNLKCDYNKLIDLFKQKGITPRAFALKKGHLEPGEIKALIGSYQNNGYTVREYGQFIIGMIEPDEYIARFFVL
jgi:hypothetical protein